MSIKKIVSQLLGCPHLQVMTKTGTFSKISYDNELLKIARQVAEQQ